MSVVVIPWNFSSDSWSKIVSGHTAPTPLHLSPDTPVALDFHTITLAPGQYLVEDGPLGSNLSPMSFYNAGFIAEPLGKYQFAVQGMATPEPSTWMLLMLGLGALLLFRRRPKPVKQEWIERRRRL